MKKNRKHGWTNAIAIAIATVLIAAAASLNADAQSAQSSGKPQFTNARVEERQVKSGLAQEVDAWAANAAQAQWLGYSVPAVSSGHRMCCGNSGGDWNGGKCGPCRLEGNKGENSYNVQNGNVKLEGPTALVVLFRAEARKIVKIRTVSEDCTLDAGGLQVIWLNGAQPGESVKLLERFVDTEDLNERGGERLSRERANGDCDARRCIGGSSVG
jgi:hypothetical protein